MDSEEISLQDNNFIKLNSTHSSRKEPLDIWNTVDIFEVAFSHYV
jgi:hypothetical protein